MAIDVGERLPEGTLLRMSEANPKAEPEAVATGPLFAGRRVVLFGMPGAFTGGCSSAHLPSFMRTKAALDASGVDAVIGLTGNDPWVLRAWGDQSGATDAGILLLGDPWGDWIEALGMTLTVPQIGLIRCSHRFSALVEDGVVRSWNEEPGPDDFGATGGEAMLAFLRGGPPSPA